MPDTLRIALSEKMRKCNPHEVTSLVGFDGFVDTIVHPVDTRTGPDTYKRIETIEAYGKKFLAAAGLSMNIEMVPHNSKIGGIGAILGNALATIGFDLTYIGACGKGGLNPVFQDFAKIAKLYSISEPAASDAIEFYDGKVISSKLEPLKGVNWNNLKEVLTLAQLAEIIDASDFVAFGGWALSINVSTIYNGILDEVFPLLKKEKGHIFFDLSDPAKRTKEDILEVLATIVKFSDKFEVGMGFNEKESYEIVELYGKTKSDFDNITDVAKFIKEKVGLSYALVHPVKVACGATDEEAVLVNGPYCEKPVLTTGAGDNFNAGFLTGKMLGFSLEESLIIGTANSGFYVRNGHSASFKELCDFMEAWGKGEI